MTLSRYAMANPSSELPSTAADSVVTSDFGHVGCDGARRIEVTPGTTAIASSACVGVVAIVVRVADFIAPAIYQSRFSADDWSRIQAVFAEHNID